mgnify:CR=1 FL=1|tara:strand:+ start:353 stop:673 length:321 start_codon:yes stop_codon:yes gene_type:complete
MKMMTKAIESKLPKIGETDGVSASEVRVRVKYFSPWSNWTWYGTEYDPETRQFFGFVKGDYPELGYFDLGELESVDVMPGVPAVERDKCWNDSTTLEQVMEGAIDG